MATRLDVFNFWLREVDRNRQTQTILTLYNAASNAVKDVIFNAFKTDVLEALNARKTQASNLEDAQDVEITDVTAVT